MLVQEEARKRDEIMARGNAERVEKDKQRKAEIARWGNLLICKSCFNFIRCLIPIIFCFDRISHQAGAAAQWKDRSRQDGRSEPRSCWSGTRHTDLPLQRSRFSSLEAFFCNCSSQPSMVHWLSSPIFPCSFVRLVVPPW